MLGRQTCLPGSIHYTQCRHSEGHTKENTLFQFTEFGAKETKQREQRHDNKKNNYYEVVVLDLIPISIKNRKNFAKGYSKTSLF